MNTPEPAQGSSPPLYGGRGARINLRTLLGCGVLLAVAAGASIFPSGTDKRAPMRHDQAPEIAPDSIGPLPGPFRFRITLDKYTVIPA